LPHPFGPTSATIERGATSRSSPARTSVWRPLDAKSRTGRPRGGLPAPARRRSPEEGSRSARSDSAVTITLGELARGGLGPRARPGVYSARRRRTRSDPKGPSVPASIATPCGGAAPLRERRRALRLAVRPCGRGPRHRCRRRVSRWIACLPCERDGPPCGEPGSPCDEPRPPCGGLAICFFGPFGLTRMIAGRARRRKGTCPRDSRCRDHLSTRRPRRPSTTPALDARRSVGPGCAWRRPSAPRACAGARAGLRDDLAS
jgi:hypothetical protein